MPTLERLFAFNRFPIKKGVFFDILDRMCDRDEFARIFMTQPRILNKVYVTMSERELISLAKRLADPQIIKEFAIGDGLYCEDKKVVILHRPAMVRMVSSIKSVAGDEQRRGLFTFHFFACLFHELAHVNEARRCAVNSWLARTPDSKNSIINDLEQFEATAEAEESRYMELMTRFLDEHNASWLWLAEALFDWEKLQRHIT